MSLELSGVFSLRLIVLFLGHAGGGTSGAPQPREMNFPC